MNDNDGVAWRVVDEDKDVFEVEEYETRYLFRATNDGCENEVYVTKAQGAELAARLAGPPAETDRLALLKEVRKLFPYASGSEVLYLVAWVAEK